MHWVTADFETSTESWLEIDDEARVWLWDICDENYYHITGTNITEFFEYLFESDIDYIYFHNLKYDGYYILNWLLRNGFSEKSKKRNIKSIITETGVWYSIAVKVKKKKNNLFR